VQGAAGPALVCLPLAQTAPHLFTTRHWALGVRASGQDDDAGWAEVAEALGCVPDRLVRVRQVHGIGVLVASHPASVSADADIIVTAEPELALAVRSADCVPLLIADRRNGAVAAAHAGWRGMAARVAGVAVAALAREFGSRPRDLMAAAGPSIGAPCYEVGSDVKERFEKRGFDARDLARWFSVSRSERWLFDGWQATRDQLVAADVPADQIFMSGMCTASYPETFCSYRRDGPPTGRLVGAIRCARPHP